MRQRPPLPIGEALAGHGWFVPGGYALSMRYMVVEHYQHGPLPVYRRAAERGRMLPDGLRFIDSWVVADDSLDRCFQLMETHDPKLFEVWLSQWADLGTFEVFPVISSAEAASRVNVRWDDDGRSLGK